MTRSGRSMLLTLVGAVTLRLVWSGGFGWFVQQKMRIPLLIAGALTLVLGIVDLLVEGSHFDRDPASARRRVAPAVGWLLALPVLVHVVVSPASLGAAAANRMDAYVPTEQNASFEPLAAGAQAEPMRVYDFLQRAIWDDLTSLEGVDVELEGLVVNSPTVPDGFLLTRFLVSCCAADGVPLQVAVHTDGRPLPDDTWVKVVVRWRPPAIPYDDQTNGIVVEADARSITVSQVAGSPYETPY